MSAVLVKGAERGRDVPGSRRGWVLANFIGFIVGGALFGALQRARLQQYFEVLPPGAEAVRILAPITGVSVAIFGASVGVAQWVVLRHRIRAGWWIPATCVGWGLSGAMLGALSGITVGSMSTVDPDIGSMGLVVTVVTGAIVIGLLPAAFQWLVLRRAIRVTGWWPLVCFGGLIAGLVAGFTIVRWGMVSIVQWLRPEDFPSAKALVLVGAVTGAVYGIVTWPVLANGQPPS